MRLQLGVIESDLLISSSSWLEIGEGVDAVLYPSISVMKKKENISLFSRYFLCLLLDIYYLL